MIKRAHLATGFTWLFVGLNAFPILWMVWCSLMGNNEILQGKTVPDPYRNDVFFVDSVAGLGVLSGTVNGELYAYQGDSSTVPVKHLGLGSVSSSFIRVGEKVWTISANQGLAEIQLPSLEVMRRYDWSWLEDQFEDADKTMFVWRPGELQRTKLVHLVNALNAADLRMGSNGPSLAAITGVRFQPDYGLVDSLNALLHRPEVLSKVLEEWQTVEGWFNPVIPWLFSKNRSALEDRELFRWCLAERFPHEVTRYLAARWTSIWVNRIPGSGHGTSIVDCGNDAICFAMWWDEFPGIGILDSSRNRVNWITAQHGLPSTAIQHLLRVGPHQLLAVTDAGLSLIDVDQRQVLHNFQFGAYGLKYLDGRDLRVALLEGNQVLLAYGQEVFLFDFQKAEGRILSTPMLERISSDITALSLTDQHAFVGTSEGVFRIPLRDWLNQDSAQSAPVPFQHYQQFFRASQDSMIFDAVVHDIRANNSRMWVGGLFGFISEVDLERGKPTMQARVPEGRFNLHWRNYEDLWKTIPFGKFLRNSFIICFSVMLIAMFVASLASYALVRFEFPGKRLFGASILATQMVPGILYLIPIFILFTAIQQYLAIEMVNTWHGIILVYSAFFIPMSTWILRGFFASIPRELEEAALIDGCSPLGAFLRITLPAALPGIIATGIYVFLLAWDELMFAWVLCTDTTTATIPVGIRLYVGQFGNRFDLLMAAASVATLPVMVLFFVMQRHIVTGLTGGAVKG